MLQAIPSTARRTAKRHALDYRLKLGGHSNTARKIELAPGKSGEAGA
jgi:hypothetical protein